MSPAFQAGHRRGRAAAALLFSTLILAISVGVSLGVGAQDTGRFAAIEGARPRRPSTGLDSPAPPSSSDSPAPPSSLDSSAPPSSSGSPDAVDSVAPSSLDLPRPPGGDATDAATESDSTDSDSAGPRPPERDYDALRSLIPEAHRALEPVALADHVPLAWWSEVTDAWLLEPARQRRRMPRRCRTRGGYREHCSGARVVPEPTGPSAALAAYFGLGERGTAMVMMHRESFPQWLALLEGDGDTEDRLTFPVPEGHAGRGFGYTRTGELRRRRHQGLDIGAPRGSNVVAARGGLVVYSDNAITGYGNMVMILHANGDSTFYAHCQATFVTAGEYVARGQRIAEVGDTGFAGGPHLHFELRRNGWPRDPRRRFLRRETTASR